MKTFRLIGIGLIAVLISFANSSCGGDDEEDDMPDSPPKEDITPSEPSPEEPEEPKDPENGEESGTGEIQGHKYVDLGLSVKWADRNIGARSPEHFGDYFAWGETEPKSNYSISNYKWNNGDETDFTKYCINSIYGYNGFTDDKTILDKEDDAAYINWGDKWRMPTQIELVELIYNCKWEWTTSNNVNGYLVTGLNGNSIFLPAAGRLTRNNLIDAGTCGRYWLSNLTEYDTYAGAFQGAPYGSELFFCYNEYNPEGIYELSEYYREYGLTIRPVVSEN